MRSGSRSRSDVVFHVLHTADLARTVATYTELLGWELRERRDLGATGVFHEVAAGPGQPVFGSISDVADRPGVHPHWIYVFRVASLDDALAKVKGAGGVVAGTFERPDGGRLAVCDDPQGSAFAVGER